MNRRTRWIVGLFALVAMTFSFGETVMAAACEADMTRHTAGAHAGDVASAHDPEHPGTPAESHPSHTPHGDEGEDGDRHCPMGDVALQLCGGVVSLPSHTASAALPVPQRVIAGFIESSEHTLLLETALFHPPRV